ncbi:hypothetical protein QFC21_000035 [Naganishia friedmannii]|uniref:Uncharacterized protein n=1 Tax=Naganishia friedmannii TaxID=89922 RepID=A0ACC2WAC4_9TREE|nr:hypothetical protein QFC21_000035 [Naganishia friedmannii]
MNLPALDVLTHYASLSTPDTQLPPDVYLLHDPWTLTIFDKFPKAKYHFLILPRVPSSSSSDDAGHGNDNQDDESLSAISPRSLISLHSLLTTTTPAEALAVLRHLEETSLEVVDMVKDEMMKTEGFEWTVEVGFHAVPSMRGLESTKLTPAVAMKRHLHLHVISTDLVSPAMKTKKHYNSFHPTLGFFLPISSLIDSLQSILPSTITSPDSSAPFNLAQYCEPSGPLPRYEPLLKSRLTCCHCREEFGNMPALKRHLEEEWEGVRKKGVGRYGLARKKV